MEENILELIKQNDGFEVTLGFCNNIDHFIGGKQDTVWYFIQNGNKEEFWLGRLTDGVWTDKHYTKKRKEFVSEDCENGTTISKLTDRLYLGQDYIVKDGRKPTSTENHGIKVDHYSFKFGELAYEISQEYGITVSYSDINDLSVGYYARRIITGEDVKAPQP